MSSRHVADRVRRKPGFVAGATRRSAAEVWPARHQLGVPRGYAKPACWRRSLLTRLSRRRRPGDRSRPPAQELTAGFGSTFLVVNRRQLERHQRRRGEGRRRPDKLASKAAADLISRARVAASIRPGDLGLADRPLRRARAEIMIFGERSAEGSPDRPVLHDGDTPVADRRASLSGGWRRKQLNRQSLDACFRRSVGLRGSPTARAAAAAAAKV